MSQPTVLVVGAAGMQASSLLRGLHRSQIPMKAVGVDREIPAAELPDGFPPLRWEQVDILTEGDRLRDLCAEADRDGVETEPARIRDLIARSAAEHTAPQETR